MGLVSFWLLLQCKRWFLVQFSKPNFISVRITVQFSFKIVNMSSLQLLGFAQNSNSKRELQCFNLDINKKNGYR